MKVFFVLDVVLWSCPLVFIMALVLCSLILFLELFVFGIVHCDELFFVFCFALVILFLILAFDY